MYLAAAAMIYVSPYCGDSAGRAGGPDKLLVYSSSAGRQNTEQADADIDYQKYAKNTFIVIESRASLLMHFAHL